MTGPARLRIGQKGDEMNSISEAIAKASGSNFYWTFRALPEDKRRALTHIYAFSRVIDDIADGDRAIELKKEALLKWRGDLIAAYEGKILHPLMQELTPTIQEYEIPREYFLDLITGVEMDLVPRRYETFGELEKYCYHVAGTIGLLCNTIFGYPHEERARLSAVAMGTAFQLTNILRDLRADLTLGRVYLPQEDFNKFQYTERDLIKNNFNSNFQRLMTFECERAADFYAKALAWLEPEEWKPLLTARMMIALYRELLRKIQKRPQAVLQGRVSLFAAHKCWILFKTWCQR